MISSLVVPSAFQLTAVMTVAGAVLAVRAAVARRVERAAAVGRRYDADGVIVGAEPFELVPPAGGVVVGRALLLHGFGDTPQTLSYLAADLAARGWVVRVPLLPGHGRTLREFARSRSGDWISAARGELTALRQRPNSGSSNSVTGSSGPVVLVGLSMGGALATILAAESPDLASVALVAPYVSMPRRLRVFAWGSRVVGLFVPYIAGRGARSIRDPAESARNLAYGAATPRLVAELGMVVRQAQAALPAVTAPTLIVASHHDNRISPDAVELTFARLGTPTKRLVWADDGAHILTVDYGHEAVNAVVGDWLIGSHASQARVPG